MAAKKKSSGKELAVIDQFESLVGYEPHPRKPGEYRKDKPYLNIDLVIDTEGLEDLGEGDILLNFPQVKLLQKMSKEFDEGSEVDDAKVGMFWHSGQMHEIPEGTKVVPLYSYKIEYRRDDPEQPFQDVFHIVFAPYDFIQDYENWVPRLLDEDDLEAGMWVLSNLFSFQFSATGNKVYKEMQSNAITNGGLYARVHVLGKVPGKNEKGSWWIPTFNPVSRLTENEKIVARSLKELCRHVWSQIESFYNRKSTLPEDFNEQSKQSSSVNVD